jgi:hypothetical protein
MLEMGKSKVPLREIYRDTIQEANRFLFNFRRGRRDMHVFVLFRCRLVCLYEHYCSS